MYHHGTHIMKTVFLTTCLALGCTSSGTLGRGCGSGDGARTPTVDSDLLGIYEIDQYQQSPGGCDQLMDVDPAPSRLVIHSAPTDENSGGAALVGQFCGSVLDCRKRVNDFPGFINYSFLQGSDAAGWKGWGIASEDMAGDQCLVGVQTHTLTSSGAQAIRIDTRQVQTEYKPPDPPAGSNEVTCSIREAIESIDADSPCTALFLLEATFETDL